MLTYAGIPLTLDPQVRTEAEAWWDEHAQDLFSYPGYHTSGIDHLPIPYPPMRRPPRPGVLVWPTGASRWAQFAAFATGEQLNAIRTVVGDPQAGAVLAIADDNQGALAPVMWMLPPRPVFQSGADELYLITLVDDRYRWWLKGDQSAPVAAATWSDLITGLITSAAGSAPTLPAIPAAYKTPRAQRWSVGAKPLPLLIDAACAAVGLRLVVNPAGAVSVNDAATAIAAEEVQWNLCKTHLVLGGRAEVADIARGTPGTVAAVFAGASDTPTTATKSLAALALAEYGNAVGLNATAQVFSDLLASVAGADRTAYTVQAANDYYRWALSRVDATFRLLQPWSPTGLEDRVEWEHTDERVITRVVRSDFADRNVNGDQRTVIPPSCCPDSPTPVTVPLVCPGSGSGSGSATDVGPTCSIPHYEPACCSFLATSKCPPDNPPNYTLTSLCSGTTLTATQLQCIITNSSCTVSSIAWKSCEISNGPGPCSEVKSKPGYCVTLANGTGAYAGVSAAVAANLTTAGFAFSYSNTGGAFTISGSLVWCCKNSVSGLYFRGKISSQLGTSSDYPCGCVVDITDACSAGSIETITAGPVLSGGVLSTQTLHIKTSCGEIDLQISPAPCPSPPPPPPPGDCNACSLLGNVPSIVIPNGPNAGTYTGTAWATTSAYGTGTPTVQTTVTLPGGGAFPAGDYVFFCYQDSPANAYQGTIWIVQPGGGSGGSFSGAQSITCGTPSIFTNIPGGQVGSSSPLTITT